MSLDTAIYISQEECFGFQFKFAQHSYVLLFMSPLFTNKVTDSNTVESIVFDEGVDDTSGMY